MTTRGPVATEVLPLREAAERLGVHYMTAYRYVRLGRLPATKQAGQWWVRTSDLEAFGLDDVGEPAARGRSRPDRYRVRLLARLIEGDERGAWAVIESATVAGTEPDRVYLDILAPVLREIGARWAAGEVAIGEEHRASAVASRIIGRLGPSFARRGRRRGSVVIGAAPGDHHALPVAMLGDILRGAGYAVVDLGADVPVDSFVAAAREGGEHLACAVCLSTSTMESGAAELLRRLREARPGMLVLLGGPAVRDEAHARALGADAYGVDAAAVLELLATTRLPSA